jgi:hypothetical protein
VTQAAAETSAAMPADQPLLCGGCGFDLRATTNDRCPECGRRFDPNHLITALIPWEQRKYIGRVRAYVGTVLLVTFTPWRVAGKVTTPVSLRDATRFRRVTVLIAFASLLAGGLMVRPWAAARSPKPNWYDEWARLLTSGWSFAVLCVGALLGLLAASRLPSAMVARRNAADARWCRTFAVLNYACAPLAWAPLVLVIAPLAWGTQPWELPGGHPDATFIADLMHELTPFPLVAGAVLLLAWLWCTLVMLRVASGCEWLRLAVPALVLPVGWGALLVLVPLALQLLVAFVVVVVISLG